MFEIPSGNGERLWPARFWVTPYAGRMVSREHGAWNTREARADHIKLATHRRRLAPAGEGKLGLKKFTPSGSKCCVPAAPMPGPLKSPVRTR